MLFQARTRASGQIVGDGPTKGEFANGGFSLAYTRRPPTTTIATTRTQVKAPKKTSPPRVTYPPKVKTFMDREVEFCSTTNLNLEAQRRRRSSRAFTSGQGL